MSTTLLRGKEDENVDLYILEVEMTIKSGMASLEHQRVSLVAHKLDVIVRE